MFVCLKLNWVTVKWFAYKAGVSEYAVRKACTQGRIKAKKFGQAWMIREKELYRYLKNRPYQRGRKPNENV